MPRPAATPYLVGDPSRATLNNRDVAILDYIDETGFASDPANSPSEVFVAKSTEASLRAALTACNANGGGQVLATGARSYTLTGTPLIFGNDVHIKGDGSTVIQQGSGQNLTGLLQSENFLSLRNTDSGAGARRFSITGLILDGNQSVNTSVATDGLQIFGYHYDIWNMRARNCRGRGFHGEMGTNGGSYMPTDPEPGAIGGLRTPMESHWDNIRPYGNRKAGFYLSGPNDSTVRRLFCAYNANASYGVPTEANAHFGPNSLAVLLDLSHVWSGGYNGYLFESSINASVIHAEGSYGPAIGVNATSVQILGGRVFFGAGWANSSFIGLKWGTGAFTSRIAALSIEGCTSGAMDFTSSSGGASTINAWVYQSGGSLYTGSPSSQITWQLDGLVGAVHPETLIPINHMRRLRGTG